LDYEQYDQRTFLNKIGRNMENNNTRKWLKSHHDTLFPFFPYLKKMSIEWLFDKLREKGGEKGALYIHIPFCTGRCTFCILTKELPTENTLKYVDAILDEAREWRDYFSSIQSIYVGGGTPTSLSSEELKLLFAGLRDTFKIDNDAEISVETTASELTEDREMFPLLTIDILYDLPGQEMRAVIADLQKAVGIGIDGISLYPLIYAPKTAIAKQFEQPPIETAIDSFENAKSFLEDKGYNHVNINHFSNGRDKFRYSTYFNNLGNILGLGAGATGFLADCFMSHNSTSEKYIQNKRGNVFSVPRSIIPVLWCVSQIQYGRVDIEEPKRRWGFDPLEAFAKTIETSVDRGEMILGKNEVELTSEGMFWANTIGAEMAVESLYAGKGELASLEEKTSKIAKRIYAQVG
jgi:oxygen-independent coproporphyrinogen-3 oxidase